MQVGLLCHVISAEVERRSCFTSSTATPYGTCITESWSSFTIMQRLS